MPIRSLSSLQDLQPRPHHPRAEQRQLLVPEPERLDRRLLGPDGAQQCVALRDDPRDLDQVAGRPSIALGQDPIQEPAPIGWGADQEEHLLRPEQDDARHVGQRRGPPRHAVDRESLANPRSGVGSGQDELDRGAAAAGAAGQVQVDAGERRAVADQVDLDHGSV